MIELYEVDKQKKEKEKKIICNATIHKQLKMVLCVLSFSSEYTCTHIV